MKMSEVTTVICNVCTSVVKMFGSMFWDDSIGLDFEMLHVTSVCDHICTLSYGGASLATQCGGRLLGFRR